MDGRPRLLALPPKFDRRPAEIGAHPTHHKVVAREGRAVSRQQVEIVADLDAAFDFAGVPRGIDGTKGELMFAGAEHVPGDIQFIGRAIGH